MTRRAWVRLAAGLTSLAVGLWYWSSSAPAATPPQSTVERPTCRVLRVVDGDSVECEVEGAKQSIRLLGIDAPELRQRPFGDRSAAALRALLPRQSEVGLELDVRERDQFGRILAYLWNEDGELINESMLHQGFAVVYILPPNVRYADQFRSAARDAQQNNRGLWATSAFECQPVDFRQKRCE